MKTAILLLCLLFATVCQAQIVTFPGGGASMGSCGSSPSLSGNNSVGTVTVGTGGVSTCVVNFSQTWAVAPKCVVSISDSAQTFSVSVSTSALTVNTSGDLSSGKVFYICALSS